MKTRRFLWVFFVVLSVMVMYSVLSYGQAMQKEVPGDDFSLEGALELFKKSSSPEDFERQLNSADARVNNLDLNGDGDIDYIRVIDKNEGNVHAFILQAMISEMESQDVAVIELEKLDNGKAVLQIIGDADVYGMETIIEPTTEVRVNAGTSTARTVVNVWAWPSVQYVYSPYYAGWVSPYQWTMRPIWWRPWRPVAYYTYNPWWQPYRSYYSVSYTHRVSYAHQIYRPMRTTSFVVYSRHHDQIAHYRMRQDNHRNDGHRNSRSSNGDYRSYNNGANNGNNQGADQRRDNDRGRSSTQRENPTNQTNPSGTMNRQQSDWRNNGATSAPQNNRVTPDRNFSADRMNQRNSQPDNHGTLSDQNQMKRMNDAQRMPENSRKMSRNLGNLNDNNSNLQRGQTQTPCESGSRQSPSFNNSQRNQQLNQQSINRGESRRGR